MPPGHDVSLLLFALDALFTDSVAHDPTQSAASTTAPKESTSPAMSPPPLTPHHRLHHPTTLTQTRARGPRRGQTGTGTVRAVGTSTAAGGGEAGTGPRRRESAARTRTRRCPSRNLETVVPVVPVPSGRAEGLDGEQGAFVGCFKDGGGDCESSRLKAALHIC
jgi:hypothetical protein